jgi:hypothetical protein
MTGWKDKPISIETLLVAWLPSAIIGVAVAAVEELYFTRTHTTRLDNIRSSSTVHSKVSGVQEELIIGGQQQLQLGSSRSSSAAANDCTAAGAVVAAQRGIMSTKGTSKAAPKDSPTSDVEEETETEYSSADEGDARESATFGSMRTRLRWDAELKALNLDVR